MGIKKRNLDTVTLRIDGYAASGEGVGRMPDGMACFVRGALRGETCLVRLDKVGKNAAWGHASQLLEASPERIAVQCPYDGNCGGCAVRHMSYREELFFKAEKVRQCLRRIGGWDPGPVGIHGAEHVERYRNKAQFPVSHAGIGFYAARSHQVVDVSDCLLQPEVCSRIRRALKEYMSACRVPAYDERTGGGLVRHLYVRVNRAGEALACVLVNGQSLPHEAQLAHALRRAAPELKGIVLGVNRKRNNVILGDAYRTLWGQAFLMDTLSGFTFRISVPSFYQVNAAQAEALYDRAVDFAGLTGRELAVDLYCGIGTISLCLARRAQRVIGVEVVEEAAADARENARRNGMVNVEFFCGDAADIAERLAADGMRPDVVVVDPPRKGLAEPAVRSIAGMEPGRVVYVSCDPATLARDVRRFAEWGYAARRAEAVDLFPRTAHVEAIVLLQRETL